MKFQNKIFPIIALSICSQAAYSAPFSFEGRSLGMGGVGVATADLATAPWANPAMLTNQRPDDDFSLLIGFGAFARDNDNLIDDIDDFQEADDRRNAAINASDAPAAADALLDMTDIITGIDGKNVAVDGSGVLALGIAFESFAMAVSVRSDAIGAGTMTNLSQTPAEVVDNQFNILNLEGVIATEFGLSFAKKFVWFDKDVSIGIKPKVVQLEAFTYTEAILDVDGIEDALDSNNSSDLGNFTSFDLGAAIELSETFRLGLNIRNVITDEFDIKGAVLNFDTEARLGLAYHNEHLTVAVDVDLIENQPLLANPVFENLKTQFMGIGAEFHTFDSVKLRVGARKNIADDVPNTAQDTAITAGIGFWLGFNLDIAAVYTENSVGAFVQSGFRF